MICSSPGYFAMAAVCAVCALSQPRGAHGPFNGHAVRPAIQRVDSVTHAPGFDVAIAAQLINATNDSVTLSYVVTVAATARDSLSSFTVDAPGVLHVHAPGPWPNWWVSTSWHNRPTAGWGKDSAFLAPGTSSPPLVYSARGVLDVVQYWAEVHESLGTVDTVLASDSIPTLPAADTVVALRGTTGFAVGVGPMPADLSPAGLAARLSNLITRACGLGWIDNHGVCNSLMVKVRPDSGSLGALLNELSAQRSKHVSEAAYILLSSNIQFLLTRI